MSVDEVTTTDSTTTNATTPVNVTGVTSGVSAVSGGTTNTCALTTAGGVKCWGINADAELGNGTTGSSTTPVDVTGLTSGVTAVAVGGNHTCAVTSTGGVKCWGVNSDGQLGNGGSPSSFTPVAVTGISSGGAAITSGAGFSCALSTTQVVACWGWNGVGNLGDGTTTSADSPVTTIGTFGLPSSQAVPPNVDLLWWAPGNASTQTEILWAELESIS